MADRDTGTQHKLRLPVELKEKIAESAKTHNRSMNADIVARLEQSFSNEGSVDKNSQIDHAATAYMVMAAAKAFAKKGLEWTEIQSNLIEILEEVGSKTSANNHQNEEKPST